MYEPTYIIIASIILHEIRVLACTHKSCKLKSFHLVSWICAFSKTNSLHLKSLAMALSIAGKVLGRFAVVTIWASSTASSAIGEMASGAGGLGELGGSWVPSLPGRSENYESLRSFGVPGIPMSAIPSSASTLEIE